MVFRVLPPEAFGLVPEKARAPTPEETLESNRNAPLWVPWPQHGRPRLYG